MDTADLTIEEYSKKGHGLALLKKEQGTPQVVEIAHTVKGDMVRVALMRKKKRKKKGKLLEVLQPSESRVDPKCEHATICGGCTLQQVAYISQIEHKQKKIERLFKEDLQKDATLLHAMIQSEDPWHYRNKMEFSFSENRAGTKFLGLMIAQGASYVFNVNQCHIAASWCSDVLTSVRKWWEHSNISAFDYRNNEGTLRTLTLREGKRTSEKLVMLTISGSPDKHFKKAEIQSFVQAIHSAIGERASIYLRLQQTAKGMPTQFYDMHLSGPDHINEKLCMQIEGKVIELDCKVSPTSFFQPNTIQAEKLYQRAFSFLEGQKESCIFDLYCGTGTLTMIASFFADRVIGIELHPESVFDAEENLKRNQITNVKFYQGDVGKTVTKLMGEPDFTPPSLVIVDPPRAGLDALALHDLQVLSPEKILYISCNPETQVANIEKLKELGYQIIAIQPVDQFPHTAHIENIVLLKRN